MSEAPETTLPASLRVTVVVPCYNAGDRVLPVLEELAALGLETLVVDDGSTDGCLDLTRPLAGVSVQRLPHNQGKGHALIAGLQTVLQTSPCDAIVLLDADGQHDPQELPRMLRAFAAAQADLLIGQRVFDGHAVPWASRFGNQTTLRFTSWLVGRSLPDTQCGYRILSRAFANRVVEVVPGGRYETEMEILLRAVKEDWKLHFVPIATRYEPGNQSSHFRKVRDSVRIYGRLLRAWFR